MNERQLVTSEEQLTEHGHRIQKIQKNGRSLNIALTAPLKDLGLDEYEYVVLDFKKQYKDQRLEITIIPYIPLKQSVFNTVHNFYFMSYRNRKIEAWKVVEQIKQRYDFVTSKAVMKCLNELVEDGVIRKWHGEGDLRYFPNEEDENNAK